MPIGVDLDFFTPKSHPKVISKKEKIKLLSVGRLIELKGHEFGIQTVNLLVKKGFNVDYTIIGEGKQYRKLKKLIIKLQLEKHITLFGIGTQEQIKSALEESHVFLMTSIQDKEGREEAQGLVTAEAQSMGLPIVGFRSGGIPHTVTEYTSVLVEQKDIEGMSHEIIDIILTDNKLSNMSLEARKWIIHNFGLEKMIDNYYRNIV